MASQQKRSFIELYNKFINVYDRLTAGRRDMKNFYELMHGLVSTEERYSKDLDATLKKQVAPLINTTLTAMYNEVKTKLAEGSKFHQGVLVPRYKEIMTQLDGMVKEVKTNKTKYLDQYNKLVKDVESKKAAHTRAKNTYEASVEKAETAVANFRSGRSQVGNDKQVKKLEEAMHAASKDLERNHAQYVKAVGDCQVSQANYEKEIEVLLSSFEELEQRRLATYQVAFVSFVDAQEQLKEHQISTHATLAEVRAAINPPADILAFITDTYDGKPLDAHAVYEPRNSEIIPHYGDVSRLTESQQHITTTQANHRRFMVHSSHQPASYANQPSSAPSSQPSFTGAQSNAAFSAPQPGAGTTSPPTDATPSAAAPAAAAAPAKVTNMRCTAIYEFAGQEVGDLPFAVNQTIELINCDPEEDWWFGQINGVQGAFPKAYVTPPVEIQPEPVAAPVAAATAPAAPTAAATAAAAAAPPAGALFQCRAEFDFEGQESDELTLRTGDVLTVFSLVEDWYEGVNAEGVRGIFPANHVTKLE